jgi:hydrogenase-4 component F
MYGVYGAELHAFSHAVVKSLLFFCAGNFFLKYKTREMDKIQGAIKVIPVTAVMSLIGIFAITGTPPFNIFLSEFLILADGFSSGRPLSIVFGSLVTIALVLIFVGFVYNAFKMIFGSPEPCLNKGEVGKFTVAAMSFLLFFVLVVSIYVPPILNKILKDIYDIVRNV